MRSIPLKESLTVEFKSDRNCLSDHDLIHSIVGMANADGGDIYLGVEDDGTLTGLHQNHQDLQGLESLVASRTSPSVSVGVVLIEHGSVSIAKINVPKMRTLTATTDGNVLRRRIRMDGEPECAPFLPHEFAGRQSSLGILDFSAQNIPQAQLTDFDPVERERLRNIIHRHNGEPSLMNLNDEQLEGALGLAKMSEDGIRRPTNAGLLLIGRKESLHRLLPTHEAAFQALEGTKVTVNDFTREPLLRIFESFEEKFEARIDEEEVEDGLFRISVPTYDRRAFREGFVNALVHRDYSRLGTVHVRFEPERLTISNPGGFVEGVTLENILTVQPRPRNPLLADIAKRIGLAERTGRGVDRIYEGMLRFGLPEPDYSQSDPTGVVLQLSSQEPDIAFIRMIMKEEEKTGQNLPPEALLVLSRLRTYRRASLKDLTSGVLGSVSNLGGFIEKLVETGLVEARGGGRGRVFILSASAYRAIGQDLGYVRQAGFNDPIQQEQMILNYVDAHGSIKRGKAIELCNISPDQASKLLRKMASRGGPLEMRGERRGAYYQRRRQS